MCTVRRVAFFLQMVALTTCSTVEEPTRNLDASATELSDSRETEEVCPDAAFHPSWSTFVIEMSEGPPVGIDAVHLTQACTGYFFYGAKIDLFTNAVGDVPADVFEVLKGPDATSAGCTSGYFVMAKGDVLGITLGSNLAPYDVLEVVAVEPDGTCIPATTTDHLKLSVADGAGRVVPIGEGTTAIVPPDLPDRVP